MLLKRKKNEYNGKKTLKMVPKISKFWLLISLNLGNSVSHKNLLEYYIENFYKKCIPLKIKRPITNTENTLFDPFGFLFFLVDFQKPFKVQNPTKFGCNWRKLEYEKFTFNNNAATIATVANHDEQKVMTIHVPTMTLWVRWAKKVVQHQKLKLKISEKS